MDYSIKYYKQEDFFKLEKIWRDLECGSEMTYFQTFEWYRMLIRFTPKDTRNYETVFVLAENKIGIPVMIAPFWIIKRTFRLLNKKGCYFLGHQGWSDYLNFIYKEFDGVAMLKIIKSIAESYDINLFSLDYIKEDSSSYKLITKKINIIKNVVTVCVKLELPESEDIYKKSLSRNMKSNLKTISNRLIRNSLDLSIIFDNKNVDISQCIKIREQRVAQKNRPRTIKDYIKRSLLRILKFKFPSYLPITDDKDSKMLTVNNGNEICAFFNYAYDINRKEILIMAVGTNENYARYSPGIYGLYHSILENIGNNDIITFDFTRGNERYKYALGGKEHYIHSVKFHLN